MATIRFVSPLPTRESESPVMSLPQSHMQWRETLKQIKKTYLKCRYKQCSAQCEQILNVLGAKQVHPLYKAYLLFFIATSYESLGLAAHDLSTKKLPYLQKAKVAFESLAEAVSQAVHREQLVSPVKQVSKDPGPPRLLSILSSPRREPRPHAPLIFGRPLPSPPKRNQTGVVNKSFESQPLLTESPPQKSPSSIQFYNRRRFSDHDFNSKDNNLIPKPLAIKKKTKSARGSQTPRPLPPPPIQANSLALRRPAIPLAINTNVDIKASNTPPTPGWTAPINDLAALNNYLRQRSITRYNSLLASLCPQINAHISTVAVSAELAIAARAEHQAQKANMQRLASFWCLPKTPEKSAIPAHSGRRRLPRSRTTANVRDLKDNDEQRARRVEELRERGWKVRSKEERGFKGAEYYERIRRRALAELDRPQARFLL